MLPHAQLPETVRLLAIALDGTKHSSTHAIYLAHEWIEEAGSLTSVADAVIM